jgi:hypothetical protein
VTTLGMESKKHYSTYRKKEIKIKPLLDEKEGKRKTDEKNRKDHFKRLA